jgi:hypothetical protein
MKKQLFDFLLCFAMLMPVSTIAMHNSIFRAMQIATGGTVIGWGAREAYYKNKQYNNPIIEDPASEKVTNFVREGLIKLNVSHHSKISVVVKDHVSPWIIINDKVIGVNKQTAAAIEADDEKAIQQGIGLNKHEIKHMINKDMQKRVYVWAVVPCVVQMVSSGLSYGFNTVFKRQSPKTVKTLVGRSLISTGAIVPKALLSVGGIIAYIRYQEAEADRFACERAESRQELEGLKAFFDEREAINEKVMMQRQNYVDADEKTRNRLMYSAQFGADVEHPRPKYRSDMVQTYLDKWDAEHKS